MAAVPPETLERPSAITVLKPGDVDPFERYTNLKFVRLEWGSYQKLAKSAGRTIDIEEKVYDGGYNPVEAGVIIVAEAGTEHKEILAKIFKMPAEEAEKIICFDAGHISAEIKGFGLVSGTSTVLRGVLKNEKMAFQDMGDKRIEELHVETAEILKKMYAAKGWDFLSTRGN